MLAQTITICTFEKDGFLFTAHVNLKWVLKKCNTLHEPILWPEIDEVDIVEIKDEDDKRVTVTPELEECVMNRLKELYG